MITLTITTESILDLVTNKLESIFKMSGGLEILAMKEDDVTKMLAAGVHLGDSNVNYQMEQYIYSVRSDGRSAVSQIILKAFVSDCSWDMCTV